MFLSFFFLHQFVSAEMTLGADAEARSFRNLTLSYRGAERQPPNVLQLGLRFSRLMELAEASGKHTPSMGTEERLRAVINDWHNSPGLQNKRKLDEDKIKAVANLVIGTCPASFTNLLCNFS